MNSFLNPNSNTNPLLDYDIPTIGNTQSQAVLSPTVTSTVDYFTYHTPGHTVKNFSRLDDQFLNYCAVGDISTLYTSDGAQISATDVINGRYSDVHFYPPSRDTLYESTRAAERQHLDMEDKMRAAQAAAEAQKLAEDAHKKQEMAEHVLRSNAERRISPASAQLINAVAPQSAFVTPQRQLAPPAQAPAPVTSWADDVASPNQNLPPVPTFARPNGVRVAPAQLPLPVAAVPPQPSVESLPADSIASLLSGFNVLMGEIKSMKEELREVKADRGKQDRAPKNDYRVKKERSKEEMIKKRESFTQSVRDSTWGQKVAEKWNSKTFKISDFDQFKNTLPTGYDANDIVSLVRVRRSNSYIGEGFKACLDRVAEWIA